MTAEHKCPYCQQRMLLRVGITLSPREADLFDLIDRHERIPMEVLCSAWAGSSKGRLAQANLVKTTINHINDKLVETDWQIKGSGANRERVYDLVRTRL